jgi:hypothetical protein
MPHKQVVASYSRGRLPFGTDWCMEPQKQQHAEKLGWSGSLHQFLKICHPITDVNLSRRLIASVSCSP